MHYVAFLVIYCSSYWCFITYCATPHLTQLSISEPTPPPTWVSEMIFERSLTRISTAGKPFVENGLNDCTLTFTCVTRCPDLTHKSLWPLATSNCGGLRPRIGSPMSQECCGLRPQQTVAASGGKIPYVLKGIVTNLYILANSTLNLKPLSKFRFVI